MMPESRVGKLDVEDASVPVSFLTGTGVQSLRPGFAADPDTSDCLRPPERSAESFAPCTNPSERSVANLRTSCENFSDHDRKGGFGLVGGWRA